MQTTFKYMTGITHLLVLAVMALGLAGNSARAQSVPAVKVLARGGGKTIVQGGTGQPGFVPVITTIAFHAERKG